jgi:predicted permease
VAYAIIRLVAQFAPADLPRVQEVTIDSTVLLFACVLSLAAALVVGLLPVIHHRSLRANIVVRSRIGRHGKWLTARGGLVSGQVALALVLLISGGLMLRTFDQLSRAETGFREPGRLQTVRVEIPATTATQPDTILRLQKRVADHLQETPGATATAYANSLPMDGTSSTDMIAAEGHVPNIRRQLRQFRSVSPGWFDTMGTPIVAGRDLTWTDVYEMRPVVLISESLAGEQWGSSAQAVGKRLRTSSAADAWREIVGVVGNVHDRGVTRPVTDLIYLPVAVEHIFNQPRVVATSLVYVIRSDQAGTPSFVAEVRQAVWKTDPSLPVASALTMSDVVQQSFARTRFTLVILLLAGGMAVLLGLVGVYAVIAYTVSQQLRDVSVRIVMGADAASIRRPFVREGLVLAAIGIVIGIAVTGLLTRGMSTLLFEVKPLDPATYAVGALVLVVTSALAVYVPAIRATRIDPIVTLRVD